MKNQLILLFLGFVLSISISCQKSTDKSAKFKSIPQPKSPSQIQPISAPDIYKYQPVKLTGKEVDYKNLKMESSANGESIAKQNGVAFTGATVYKTTNGQIFIYQNYKDGIKHGAYQFQKNGQDKNGNPEHTFETGTMINGKLNGQQLTYYDGPGGPLKKVAFYKDDEMNGQWLSYYRSGAQWTLRDFNKGKLDGKVLVWEENGLLGKEFTYQNGVMTEKVNHFKNRK